MLDPNTALENKSVWSKVNVTASQTHVKKLCRLNYFDDSPARGPEKYHHHHQQGQQNDSPYLFLFDAEQCLADDLAFIAAFDIGVEYVTAATIEATIEAPGIRICIAANEGISECVHVAFRRILDLLEKCARKEISKAQCEDDVFDHVIRLDSNRVFGRLKSSRCVWPSHMRDTDDFRPLGEQWQAALNSAKALRRGEDLHHFATEVDAFNNLCTVLEKIPDEDTIPALKAVVKEAFKLTKDGYSLLPRLEELGFPNHFLQSRKIRDLNKVASYWRVCHNLAELCRSRRYRSHFQSLVVHFIEPYAPLRTPGTKEKRFVHAEIQLLIHFELSAPDCSPRAIGSSKSACYLCNTFIRAHGMFRVSKSHGKIFQQWTVPDLVQYNGATLSRLQNTLVQVNHRLQAEIAQLRQSPRRFSDPHQSSSSLHQLPPMTPSSTTVTSSADSISTITPNHAISMLQTSSISSIQRSAGICHVTVPAAETALLPSTSSLSHERVRHKVSSQSQLATSPAQFVIAETSMCKSRPDAKRYVPVSAATNLIHMDWLDLYAELESLELSTVQDTNKADSRVRTVFSQVGGIRLEKIDDNVEIPGYLIDVNDLEYGKDITLEESGGSNKSSLNFVLVMSSRTAKTEDKIQVECRWF